MSPSDSHPNVWTVVVAAGSGVRFGGPKQLVEIGGSTPLDMAIAAARSVSHGVVVVGPASMLAQLQRPGVVTVVGGETRAESVRKGLAAVPVDADLILVHDAARPLASAALFERVVDALRAGEEAVVPVVPVVDSLKRKNEDGSLQSMPRDGVFAAQTPQGFRAQVLREVHATGVETTDDGGAAGLMGFRVAPVEGEFSNMKLTTPGDLVVMRALVAASRAGSPR